MDCYKRKQRNLFNMFEIYSCNNCINEIIYNYIYIGNNIINVYILNNECINYLKKQKMIKLFIKECLVNINDLFIIIDKNEYLKYFDYFPLFIEDNNLFILVI